MNRWAKVSLSVAGKLIEVDAPTTIYVRGSSARTTRATTLSPAVASAQGVVTRIG